jgi:hypothetical protein
VSFALLVVLAAAPALGVDDPAQRLAAVESWAKKQKKPQLSFAEAKKLEGCVELPAVKDTGCEQPAKLCRVQEGDDGSSGTRVEQLSFVLAGHEALHKHLRVWWYAAYEPRRHECDPPDPMTGEETPTQKFERVALWRKGHQKEWKACIKRVEKDSADDSEELSCDVVMVNACRMEAFITCRARNLRKGIGVTGKLQRFEF